MESAFKKVRLIWWVLLASIPLFVWVAEMVCGGGSSDWTWRYWLVAGLGVWTVSGAFRLRGLSRRSVEKLKSDATDAKAARQWEAGQIFSLAGAESLALWGLVVRMVFHGTLWQASIFYVVAVFLLLLWTPPYAEKDRYDLILALGCRTSSVVIRRLHSSRIGRPESMSEIGMYQQLRGQSEDSIRPR